MTDELPPWATYTNGIRDQLNTRIDKEIEDRQDGDKDLAADITALTATKIAARTWWVRSLVIAGVTVVASGLITLIVTFLEAYSHLSGGGKP